MKFAKRERGREGGKRGRKIEEGKGGRNGGGRKKRRRGREKKEENTSCIFCISYLPCSQHKWAVSP